MRKPYIIFGGGHGSGKWWSPCLGLSLGTCLVLVLSGWRKGRLIYQFLGLEPENTEYQKTIADQTTGRTYRFDSSYDNGKIKYLDEVKSGYVSGQSYESKALEYQRIASQQGATLRYFFYGEASGPFKNFLNRNLIYWEQY